MKMRLEDENACSTRQTPTYILCTYLSISSFSNVVLFSNSDFGILSPSLACKNFLKSTSCFLSRRACSCSSRGCLFGQHAGSTITNLPLARNGNSCGFSKAESSNRRRGGLEFNWRTDGGTIASLMLRFSLVNAVSGGELAELA
jgi:hypothetical protein